jgi:glycyl-tRNA synthetase beta chain
LELLFEIGTEELPPSFVRPALDTIRQSAGAALGEARMDFSEIRTLGTPRRLVLIVEGLAGRQRDSADVVFGPPESAAFDAEGKPTKAAIGFAKSQGMDAADLKVAEKGKGRYVCVEKKLKGEPSETVLPGVLESITGNLSFPKSMRWEETGVRFARPIRWIACVLDGRPLEFSMADVTASAETSGHRFLGSKQIKVKSVGQYIDKLRHNHVIVDHEERKTLIRTYIAEAAASVGGRVVEDDDLLERVTFAVEFPLAVAGSFSPDFLEMPKQVIVTALKEHQDFFSVCDPDGSLMPHFIAVANTDKDRAGKIKGGNERVLKARLADAHFYWKEDLRDGLDKMAERLSHVVWQEQLGTLSEKTERVARLAEKLVERTGLSDKAKVKRAAHLSKADLTSQMVREKEFSSLQGYMGKEYGSASGEDPEVAEAIFEHYLPRFAGDILPSTDTGIALALADRIDSLVGCFSIGLIPTGSADPFALRRQATGFVRILMEKATHISLRDVILASHGLIKDQLRKGARGAEDGEVKFLSDGMLEEELVKFLGQRVETLLVDRGERRDMVQSVVDVGIDDPALVTKRLDAVKEFESDKRFGVFITAFKRAYNISKGEPEADVNSALLIEKEEKDLYETYHRISGLFSNLMYEQEFAKALGLLLELSAPIDVFFDQVMVMAEDENLRRNRLALLGHITYLFGQMADFSKLEVG